jgi:hypothetical protein
MSAKDEADIRELQGQMLTQQQGMLNLSTQMFAAVSALVERMDTLETIVGNNAVVEGDDIQVKAAPNGQAKTKKAHR